MNEKILSQEEINALLDTVGTDQFTVAEPRDRQKRSSRTGGSEINQGKRNLFPLVRVQR